MNAGRGSVFRLSTVVEIFQETLPIGLHDLIRNPDHDSRGSAPILKIKIRELLSRLYGKLVKKVNWGDPEIHFHDKFFFGHR